MVDVTSACNLTVKTVTLFAKKTAKPAPVFPAVEAGVMHYGEFTIEGN